MQQWGAYGMEDNLHSLVLHLGSLKLCPEGIYQDPAKHSGQKVRNNALVFQDKSFFIELQKILKADKFRTAQSGRFVQFFLVIRSQQVINSH